MLMIKPVHPLVANGHHSIS